MRLVVILFYALVFPALALCQRSGIDRDPYEVIRSVWKAQDAIRTVSYTLERSDTFVTGETRKISGRALIKVAKEDPVFGFLFRSAKDGYHGESVYDGHTAYATDDDRKTYRLTTRQSDIPHALGDPGGQIILTDLMLLDTSRAIAAKAWEDDRNTYLLFSYPDLTEYDVTKRTKTVTIDKKTLLPMAIRSRQETLGKSTGSALHDYRHSSE